MYFQTPSELIKKPTSDSQVYRLGGMVAVDTVSKNDDNLKVIFRVTDFKNSVEVRYEGILPDLFREGQGVVVIGRYQEKGIFEADTVLAKHDEKYMPKAVHDGIYKSDGYD